MPTRGLTLDYASLWHALLENRKRYELRRARVGVPPEGLRLLFVCSEPVREREGLSLEMAEGFCYRRLGPYTAGYIMSRADLLGSMFATPDEIRQLLPVATKTGRPATGYVYEIVGVKRSQSVTWADWPGNGSDQSGFMKKRDKHEGKDRWVE